ncbi:uncharacterized protein N7498_003183 [Penicillium cinerascens]|uniref:CCHC-type domain-containing protein n=1 Tax=Penicillium cinerascens TaxID=70096 RepID=A0A9W9N1P1_9EURO|nr:uncharacterized protein N7498_003183 [Penicillium cinerascens]KAJ5211537.1 hypothetical protein N7498_003183 [Penicillium cinerascens]
MADAGGEPPRPPNLWCNHCRRPGHDVRDCWHVLARRAAFINSVSALPPPKRYPGVKKTRRGTRAGRGKKAAKHAGAAAAAGVSFAQGTGVALNLEGLTPAECQQLTGVVDAAVSAAVAQFMAARSVGASPQVDGRSQQPGQRNPVVRQSIAGPEEENKDGEKEDDMSVDLGPFPQ